MGMESRVRTEGAGKSLLTLGQIKFNGEIVAFSPTTKLWVSRIIFSGSRCQYLRPMALVASRHKIHDLLVQHLIDDFLNHGSFRVETSFLTILESGSAERRENRREAGGRAASLGWGIRTAGVIRTTNSGSSYMTSVWPQWGPGGVTFTLWMFLR